MTQTLPAAPKVWRTQVNKINKYKWSQPFIKKKKEEEEDGYRPQRKVCIWLWESLEAELWGSRLYILKLWEWMKSSGGMDQKKLWLIPTLE